MSEASQMPDARVRKDFPDVARRMREITPERTQQAKNDDDRISNGLAPLHPELAQIWPDVYGKANGVTAPLPVPKAPRVKHDPRSVTGLDTPAVSYLKAALRQSNPSAYSLSAETGRLAVTPAPRGKPGGPGLYGVKGNMHSPYLQQIVKALIRKGMPPGKAYAIAWGSMRRWAGKSKHPEVRAAAAGGLALEKVAEARAHAHAWDGVAGAVELAAIVKAPAPGPSLYDRYVAQVQQLQAAVALRMQAASAKKAIAASGVKVPAAPAVPVAASKPKGAVSSAVPAKQAPPAGVAAAKTAVPPATAAPKPPAAPPAKAPAVAAAAAKPAGGPPATPAPGGPPAPPPTIPQLQAKIAALTAQLATLIKGSAAPAKTPAPATGGQSHTATRAGAVELAPTTGQPRQQAGGGQQSAAQKAEPRIPAGQAGGGRFGTGGGSKPAAKPDAHQQHVAHVAHVQAQAKTKAGLLSTAKTDRAKAATLIAQRKALQAELASASGATSSGQSGATTSSGASTTASTAPAAASTTTASSTATSAGAGTSTAAPTAAQLTTQITGLTTQINTLLAAAKLATAQAAKI